jgi:hypothetical protein
MHVRSVTNRPLCFIEQQQVTQQKIRFLNDRQSDEFKAVIHELIAPEQLEPVCVYCSMVLQSAMVSFHLHPLSISLSSMAYFFFFFLRDDY